MSRWVIARSSLLREDPLFTWRLGRAARRAVPERRQRTHGATRSLAACPFVSTKLYLAQPRTLDRDKDGVACET
jgi:hypothetical protein